MLDSDELRLGTEISLLAGGLATKEKIEEIRKTETIMATNKIVDFLLLRFINKSTITYGEGIKFLRTSFDSFHEGE